MYYDVVWSFLLLRHIVARMGHEYTRTLASIAKFDSPPPVRWGIDDSKGIASVEPVSIDV